MLRGRWPRKRRSALKAKDLMAAGALVPDEVVRVGIISDRIDQPNAAKGFILDGSRARFRRPRRSMNS